MNFSSDTSAPIHPSVIEALAAVNTGMAASYGSDSVTKSLREKLAAIFETEDFDFMIVASGTASNALALACLCSPLGAVLCHEEAHIQRDERGAPEFFTGGARLQLLPGFGARIDREALESALAHINPAFVHETPAEVLSLTNLTECGTAYRASEVALYAGLAKEKGLAVHMDGARFANMIAGSTASPAEMSWRAGVDILTFGLTKTGAMGCEIIMLFGETRKKLGELHARAKRAGHMPPKMRYLAAQAKAMLEGGRWLELAKGANARAQELADAFMKAGVELAYPVDGNEVFAFLSPEAAKRLSAAGGKFYPWQGGSYRFVCAWNTGPEDVRALAAALAG